MCPLISMYPSRCAGSSQPPYMLLISIQIMSFIRWDPSCTKADINLLHFITAFFLMFKSLSYDICHHFSTPTFLRQELSYVKMMIIVDRPSCSIHFTDQCRHVVNHCYADTRITGIRSDGYRQGITNKHLEVSLLANLTKFTASVTAKL